MCIVPSSKHIADKPLTLFLSFLSINKSNPKYSIKNDVLSYFKLANINFNKKDFQSMEMYYDKIMSLDNINKAYKDYALILKITNSPNINNDDKIKSLKPFLTSPSEFQPIASELEILYLIENKKMKTSKIKLDKLLKQNNISNNQRNRLSTIDEIYFK